MKTLTFHVLEDGSLDCHQLSEDGVTYSFDPAQLPKNLDALLPKALKAALVAKDAAERKLSEAHDIIEKAHSLDAAAAQLEAKDAIIQDLMEKLASV